MFHVTFRQLTVFSSVARNLSFTRAAEELHLSQPAVSMQVRQLEDHIGLPLFEQLGKKIFLTEAGHEIYHYARNIAEQLLEAEAVIADLKGLKRGKLKIAVASTANYVAPKLLATFSQHYPTITVSLDVTNRQALLAELENNDIELAIMGKPPKELDLVAESFMENPLVIIAPANHRLAKVRNIPLQSLRNKVFLIREPGSGTRIAMERFFAEHALHIVNGMEMNSSEAIKQAVQAGLGLGVVSLHTVELELEAGRLVVLDVEHMPIQRHWYIVHRREKRLSGTAMAFKRFLLEDSAALIQSFTPRKLGLSLHNDSTNKPLGPNG